MDNVVVTNSGTNNGVILTENNGSISIYNVQRMQSRFPEIIKSIGDICLEDDLDNNSDDYIEYKPDEKINYNEVIKYREIIQEYSIYYAKCDNYLNVYDDSHFRGKAKILKCINNWYKIAKGDVLKNNNNDALTSIEIIRKHSDEIIDTVIEKITNNVKASLSENMIEDMELGIICFTCYCFMECKILEKPV